MSVSRNKHKIIRANNTTRSTTLSANIVPNALSKGTDSYVCITVALNISPERGTPKFAK